MHALRVAIVIIAAGGRYSGVASSSATASSGQASPGSCASESRLVVVPQLFTAQECDSIVSHFVDTTQGERDVRVAESVSRTTFFDHDGGQREDFRWILDRILAAVKRHYADERSGSSDGAALDNIVSAWGFNVLAAEDGRDLGKRLDFVLMHRFENQGGEPDFFDFHCDTKPGDGTGRTMNINVMLSSSRRGDFSGGTLRAGVQTLSAGQGDLCFYPASLPHCVEDITAGTRHTLVLAVRVPDADRARTAYWDMAAAAHDNLRTALRSVPKIHLLRGEWLAAQGRDAEADDAYAESYASTPQAEAYAEHFDAEALRLAEAGEAQAAASHKAMARRVRALILAAGDATSTIS